MGALFCPPNGGEGLDVSRDKEQWAFRGPLESSQRPGVEGDFWRDTGESAAGSPTTVLCPRRPMWSYTSPSKILWAHNRVTSVRERCWMSESYSCLLVMGERAAAKECRKDLKRTRSCSCVCIKPHKFHTEQDSSKSRHRQIALE